MQLRRDNETDQERKSGPYYGMPSQKYENQNPYNPCNIDEIAEVVRIVEIMEVSKHYE